MRYSVRRWVRIVRPFVEKEFGPLPRFQVRAGKLSAWRVQHHARVPWTCHWDRKQKASVLTHYPARIRTHLRREEYGYLLQNLIHDIMHVYENKILASRPYTPWQIQWYEGAVELVSWKITARILESPRRYGNLASQMFGDTADADPEETLEGYAAHNFSALLGFLHKRGIIAQASLTALRLPFELPPTTRARIKRPAFRPQELRMTYSSRYNIPYALGLARCSRIVSSGTMTINELLRTPMTDRKLRQLAGI